MSDQTDTPAIASTNLDAAATTALGVPVHDPVTENEPARKRAEAKSRAQQAQIAEQERVRAEATARAEEEQASTSVVPVVEEKPNTVGDGAVELKYLGTSDSFIVGKDENGKEVRAIAGGDSVHVPQDLADTITALPYDSFEKVS